MLKIDISPDAQTAFADRVRVHRVLANLLRNAAEAVANSPCRLISITAASHTAEQIVIRIEDSGPGVPPEVKRHLFSLFISTKDGRLGVGLPISRSIVEAHGGQLWVEDATTGGAAFCFTLPKAGVQTTT